jgi:mannitol/fructose-specific phosphotransferase system IIA component (Ntr-type)
MKICGLLKENHIFFDLKPGDKEKVLRDFVQGLKARGLILDEEPTLDALLQRESLGSTGLEKGIGVPHALTSELEGSFLALAVFQDGINFDSADQMPTYVLLMVLGNQDRPGAQLKILAHICRLVKETDIIEKLRAASVPSDVCRILKEEEAKIL